MFEFLSVNWLAVLIAAITQMILGFIWFSPALFGKIWMILHGIDPNSSEQVQQMRKSQGKTFPIMFIMTLVNAYILAIVFRNLGIVNISNGLQVGFWLWVGFLFTYIVGNVLVSGQKKTFIWLELGHTLIGTLAASVILSVWK